MIFRSIFTQVNRPKMTALFGYLGGCIRFMIFGRLIVFGGLTLMPSPVRASVEDISSLQSVRRILLQLYGIRKATLTVVLLFLLGTSLNYFFTVILSMCLEL